MFSDFRKFSVKAVQSDNRTRKMCHTLRYVGLPVSSQPSTALDEKLCSFQTVNTEGLVQTYFKTQTR
jgi:hypothetical protein